MAPGSAETIRLKAPKAVAGERLDRFLAAALGKLSRSRVKSLILAGSLTVNGRPVIDPAASVVAGLVYTLVLPAPQPASPTPQPIPLSILFEDDHVLVLDKPAGLVVHPAPGNPEGTLVNALLAHCGATLPGLGGERRPGIVHRLDKDTSGVMVVAKTERALTGLSAAFARHDLERAYIALVWGVPALPAGVIEAPIGRDPRHRKRMAVRSSGKPALTNYRLLRAWLSAVALLECRLGSGRTHQIRVHLAHLGHPLVGDSVYLRRIPAPTAALSPPLRQLLLDFPRQALHATRLGFRHPASGEALRFTSPLPSDIIGLIAALDACRP